MIFAIVWFLIYKATHLTTNWANHYIDVIMTTVESQITSLTVAYSNVYSDADQRKHQSYASLAFVWGIHRDRWIPRTKGQLRGKCFHLMTSSWYIFWFSGYAYMSIIKDGDTLQEAPSYRPEIGDEIWDGFISFDPLYPSGEDWHRFAQMVNDEYSANLPANASTTSVNVPLAAGNAEAIFQWRHNGPHGFSNHHEITIWQFLHKKINLNMSCRERWPFYLVLNV